MRKTKIVCTIGPACDSEETLRAMMLAGMNVARLNFSHGTHAEHQVRIDRIKKLRAELDLPIAIMLDTKGPEYRIGTFDGGKIELHNGDTFTFTTEPVTGSAERVSVSYAGLAQDLEPGDTVLGLALDHGGHLTHGMKINFSGRFYHAEAYGVNPETFRIDPEIIRQRALETHPAMIIGGWSAYPRIEDFKAMKEIADEVGAKFWVDMAHFAGLVAAGLHPSPVPYADVVSSTAHKTLGGPRSGFILAKQDYAKKLNSAVFPGQQGGPLMHVIAGKAVAFKVAASPEFKDRMQRTLDGAKILAERLMSDDVKNNGISVLTGGTDVHLVMVDLRNSEMDGQQGEDLLAQCGITINRNTVPFDPRPASVASGLRIGTSALATRGFGNKEYEEVADIIGTALAAGKDADVEALRARVDKLAEDFPLYPGLDQIH